MKHMKSSLFLQQTFSWGKVKCTYVEIPQVRRHTECSFPTFLELGSGDGFKWVWSHDWEWSNFLSRTISKATRLDRDGFLRLALERSKTAEVAMNTIIELLEKYGQSGNCGYAHPFYYHNSYLICDIQEAGFGNRWQRVGSWKSTGCTFHIKWVDYGKILG